MVALGVASAGKSSVLSALADRRGLFRAADLPGVTLRVEHHVSEPLLLVDTPGLDVDDDESSQALEAARRADTILYCHSLRMGELRRLELAVLGSGLGATERRRTCMVLTHADNVPSEQIVADVSTAIAAQLAGLGMHFRPVGPPEMTSSPDRRPPFNVVGIGLYWAAGDAQDSRRRLLLRRSGIPRLRNHLRSMASPSSKAQGTLR